MRRFTIRLFNDILYYILKDKIMNRFPTIEDLFSDSNRLRLIKYFIRNPENFSEKTEIAKCLNVRRDIIERQAKHLVAHNFLKARRIGRVAQYSLNNKFYLYAEIKNLVNKSIPINDDDLVLKLQGIGKIQVALVAGVFINNDNSRADMVIVGRINPTRLNKFIKFMESQICRELNFVVMTTEEFKYRYKMFDRFVHDMLEFPHKKIIFKIKLQD